MYTAIGKIARKIGEFKGKKRLARVLLNPYIAKASNIEINGDFECNYLLPNIKESVAFELFINGIYEMETHQFLLSVMPQDAVYFDVGANIGSVSIPLCKRRPDIRCFAIEASDWVYHYLVENVKRNNLEKNMICINQAIAETADGFVSFYTDEKVFGKGSMSPVFSNEASQVKRTTFKVLMERFQLNKIDVVKMDIEGFEYFAFQGGEEIFRGPDAPLVLFEFVSWAERHAGLQPGDAQRLLKSWGYTLYQHKLDGSLVLQESIVEQGGAMLVATKKNLK